MKKYLDGLESVDQTISLESLVRLYEISRDYELDSTTTQALEYKVIEILKDHNIQSGILASKL